MGTQIHLVTGGSGFIGIHIVAQLLETNYIVHATVRSTKSGPKIQPLQNLQKKYPEKLKLFGRKDPRRTERNGWTGTSRDT